MSDRDKFDDIEEIDDGEITDGTDAVTVEEVKQYRRKESLWIFKS